MTKENFILETERLNLREFNATDAEVMYRLNSNPNVMKYTGDVYFNSVEESEKLIVNYPDYRKNGFGRWATIRKKDNQFIGWCGLKLHEDNLVDIGYRFFEEYWNQGYATESAKACIEYGLTTLNLTEIYGNSSKENIGSIRVMEKIGLEFWKEGEYDGMKNAVQYRIKKK